MSRLVGKRALVTGGRQGIGRGIVNRLLVEGASVVTGGRGERPRGLPATVAWVAGDLFEAGTVDALVNQAVDESGEFDLLVNNAGVQLEKTTVDTTDQDYDALMSVNVRGVFMLCRAAIPKLRRGGSIINIGSISATTADPGLALYNASKAFVEALTRSIAVDHGPDVRCNAISPGWIMTDMADAAFAQAGDPDAAKADALARHPVARFGTPEDVASLVVWLASDEAAFVTGQCYRMDGGLTAASPLNPNLF